MRIFLINPPWYVLQGGESNQNSTPLGACYLAAMLESGGHDARVMNADRGDSRYENEWTIDIRMFDSYRARDFRQHPVWKKIADSVASFRPDVVGITVRTPAVESSLFLCETVKRIDRGIFTVVGGPHPTALPDEMLESPYVDFVVRREGEATIVELVNALSSGSDRSSVAGLSYKRGQAIHHNPDRPFLDIDTIPHPAKHLMLDIEAHDQDDFNPILASRGCPYQCIFCASANVWSRKVRFRDPADVVQEMRETCERFDTHFFSFEDDTFTIRRDICFRLFELIVDSGLQKVPGFRWVCNTRPELLDPELLRAMRRSGCAAVAIGIESGNDRILKRLKKNYTVAHVKEAARMIKEAGLVLSTQFMIGLPFETEDDMWDTVRLAEALSPESVMLSVATPLPKTELYTLASEKGYFKNGIRWAEVTTKNDGILFNTVYSPERKARIMEAVRSAFEDIQKRTIEIKIASRKRYEDMYKKSGKDPYPRAPGK